MQRNVDESFAAYKARRAEANLAVKLINAKTRGGHQNNRAKRLGKGQYGRALASHFAKQNATLERLHAHRMHLAHMAARKEARAGQ